MKKYKIGLDGAGVSEFVKGIQEYKKWIQEKSEELCSRLASIGGTNASISFARSVYKGINDATISVEGSGLKYVVRADGESVLFIEFGSGITYGYGHPEASEHGMGPGTYPDGKGHWNDPRGWWIPKEKGGGHTYGNPPNAPMYNAVKTLEEEIAAIVKEVFQ